MCFLLLLKLYLHNNCLFRRQEERNQENNGGSQYDTRPCSDVETIA